MTTFTFKVDEDLKKAAETLAKKFGISLSAMIKMLLKDTVRRKVLHINAKPTYSTKPQDGDITFKDPADSLQYCDDLAENDGQVD